MINTIQPTLMNFSVFQHIGLFDRNVTITNSGIVHTNKVFCPDCGTVCSYNGSSNKGHNIFSRSYNSFLRKGQQFCPECKKTIQVDNYWLDNALESFNGYLVSEIVSLSSNFSEDEIVNHLENTKSIIISKSLVHNIINASNEELSLLDFDYKIKHEFYGYDEQYITIDGKRAYRLVFYDLKNDEVIYEKTHYKFSKKILQEILKEVFKDSKPKGFVFDMRLEYPSAFQEVFGRKIKLQFCVFHLNKLILNEYNDCLRIGKKTFWTITEYFNLYTLFDVFYDRSYELSFLKKLSKNFESFKEKLTIEKIEMYAVKYELNVKKFDTKQKKVIEIIEKKLLKAFRKMLHSKKLERKRKKNNLIVRSVESARGKLDEILLQKSFYPEKIQKRIERINKNFEYFTGSNGEVLTNNKLEGFFGATLKKFRKKIKKTMLSFSALLNRKRAERKGISIFKKFTLHDLTKIFMTLSFFN
jgi:hypothetical protein